MNDLMNSHEISLAYMPPLRAELFFPATAAGGEEGRSGLPSRRDPLQTFLLGAWAGTLMRVHSHRAVAFILPARTNIQAAQR